MNKETISKLLPWKGIIDASGGKTFFVFARDVTFAPPKNPSDPVIKPGGVIYFSKTEITLTNYTALLKKEVLRIATISPTQVILGRVGKKLDSTSTAYILKYHYSKIEKSTKDEETLRGWFAPLPFLKGAKFVDSKKAETNTITGGKGAKTLDAALTAAAKKEWVTHGKTAKANFETMKKMILKDADVKNNPALTEAAKALSPARVEVYTKGLDAAFSALEAVAPKKGVAPQNPLAYAKAVKDFRTALKALESTFSKDAAFQAIDDPTKNPFTGTPKVANEVADGLRKLVSAYGKAA